MVTSCLLKSGKTKEFTTCVPRFFSFSVVLFVSLFINVATAQKISKVELTEIKKGADAGSYSLVLSDFPREAGPVKTYVQNVSSVNGVSEFNVLSHPMGKPANALLKVSSTETLESILREVLCALDASSYVFKKKSFSNCNTFSLNKK